MKVVQLNQREFDLSQEFNKKVTKIARESDLPFKVFAHSMILSGRAMEQTVHGKSEEYILTAKKSTEK